MSKITYADKEYIYENASIPEINKITDGNMNEIKRVVNANDDRLTTVETGWVSANETWTYASADDPTGVITISGDVTTKYSLGMRIKFTNGGNVIYGIITKLAYSSPNTTLTFLHEINPTKSNPTDQSIALHLMANSAITANYYSNMKAPFGFPLQSKKWTVEKSFFQALTTPTKNVWANVGTLYLDMPIGSWDTVYDCGARIAGTLTGPSYFAMLTTLSTTNNSETNSEFTLGSTYDVPASGTYSYKSHASSAMTNISVTAKTRQYLNYLADTGGTLNATCGQWDVSTIKFICAYL